MSVQTPPEEQLIRFEDVTPARDIVAFFAGSLKPLVAHLNLPVYLGYDDLDELLFTFLTLPSGKAVTLGQYRGSPQVGVDLYVDPSIQDVPAVIYESCQQLGISHSEVTWLHADVQERVDRLYAENGDFAGGRAGVLSIEEWPKINEYEPIRCFQHSLSIYDRQTFPERMSEKSSGQRDHADLITERSTVKSAFQAITSTSQTYSEFLARRQQNLVGLSDTFQPPSEDFQPPPEVSEFYYRLLRIANPSSEIANKNECTTTELFSSEPEQNNVS
jgi:hypothetical protein